MSLIEQLYTKYVFDRRVRMLSNYLGSLLPEPASVLDIGCGNGLVSHLIMQNHQGVEIKGTDVLIREKTYIPVEKFDGSHFPYEDSSFDVVMFVDVLHHTEDPMTLLREAKRVARRAVVIKDHFREGLFAGPTLRFMDWVGNARYGVALPHNYWSRGQWQEAIQTLGLTAKVWHEDLGLYPRPANWIFGRSLHFVASFDITS